MDNLFLILVVLSALALPVLIVILIIRLFQKKPNKPIVKSMAAIFALFILSLIIFGVTHTPPERDINEVFAQITEPTPEPIPEPEPETELMLESESDSPQIQEDVGWKIISTQERLHIDWFGDTRWQSLIEIKNTGNVPLHLGTFFDNRYDLEDENGMILATGSFRNIPMILHPGEVAVMFGVETLTDVSVDDTVTFIPHWSISESRHDRINFDISDVSIRNAQGGGINVTGRITNNTGSNQLEANVYAILYTEDGTLIGAWRTTVRNLDDGASMGFELGQGADVIRTLIDNPTPDMVASYVIYAYPTQRR